MTILSVLEGVAPRIGLDVPSAVFSSTEREHVELKELINDTARMIRRAYPWQLLSTIKTYTGDGSTVDFSLPDDYDWMPDDNQLFSSVSTGPLAKVKSNNDWLEMLVTSTEPQPGAWIIYGGQIHIRGALADAATAKHFYQSSLHCDPVTGSNASVFTLDTDTFRLSEDLLKAGLLWRWKADKGLPYAEQMQDYERLKEQLISRDKGATILKQGTARMPRDAVSAYPGNVPIA